MIGVLSMKEMDRNSEDMYNNNVLPVQNVKDIQIVFGEVRTYHIYAVYDTDRTKLQERINKIDELVGQTNALLEEYRTKISSEEEQKLYDTLSRIS